MGKLLRCMSVADEEVAKKATFKFFLAFICLGIITIIPNYVKALTDVIIAIEIIIFIVALILTIYATIIMYKSGKKNLEEKIISSKKK